MLEFLAAISTAIVAVTIGIRLVSGTYLLLQGCLSAFSPEFYAPLRTLGLNFHAGCLE
jgi:ATP-binding cassette subfamily C protein CydD